jgi:hypothetical protein
LAKALSVADVLFQNSTFTIDSKANVGAVTMFILSVIGVCLSVLFFVSPVIFGMERTQRGVFEMFLDLSTEQVRELQQVRKDHLMSFGSAAAIDAEDEEEDESDDDSDNGSKAPSARPSVRSGAGGGGGFRPRSGSVTEAEQDIAIVALRKNAAMARNAASEQARRSSATAAAAAAKRSRRSNTKRDAGPGARSYRVSRWDHIVLLLKVIVIVLAAFVFYTLLFFNMSSSVLVTARHIPYMRMQSKLATNVAMMQRDTLELLVSPVVAAHDVLPMDVATATERLNARHAVILKLVHGLEFGDESEGLVNFDSSEARQNLLYGNLCGELTFPVTGSALPGTERSQARCAAFWSGLNTHGLVSILTEVVHRTKSLEAVINVRGTPLNAAEVLALWASSEVAMINEASTVWVALGMQLWIQDASDEALRESDNHVKYSATVVGVFALIILSLAVFVYEPMVRDLDFRLKRTRGMMLMVPIGMLETVKSFRSFVASAAL